VAQLDAPQRLREVIGQRVARLSPLAGRALHVAAVAGPSVSFLLLEQVLGEQSGVLDALDEVVAAGLLTAAEHGEYVFAHELVRRTIKRELGPGRRMRLQRQIAQALQALHATQIHVQALAS
jgi:predicted ATPase